MTLYTPRVPSPLRQVETMPPPLGPLILPIRLKKQEPPAVVLRATPSLFVSVPLGAKPRLAGIARTSMAARARDPLAHILARTILKTRSKYKVPTLSKASLEYAHKQLRAGARRDPATEPAAEPATEPATEPAIEPAPTQELAISDDLARMTLDADEEQVATPLPPAPTLDAALLVVLPRRTARERHNYILFCKMGVVNGDIQSCFDAIAALQARVSGLRNDQSQGTRCDAQLAALEKEINSANRRIAFLLERSREMSDQVAMQLNPRYKHVAFKPIMAKHMNWKGILRNLVSC